ncbi:MAG: glucose-1-phosphate cytidylyltransferase [Verrucomicrobiales bacterium]|nr:glucose-1-phosphate cytidylyltransferase [Verrucomicrobiales bacterium]
MKVGILAGGFGTRLAEETEIRPKPMVEIGGKPILWHIMMHYSRYGHREFAIALGHKGAYIKRWFNEYHALDGSMTFHTASGDVKRYGRSTPEWTVDLVETGQNTLTGGRIKRLLPWMGDGTFMLTWGDGLSDVNLDKLFAFHRSHGKLATMTAVRPVARYGHIEFDGDRVVEFTEKPQAAEGWINGAFFVLEAGIGDYIDGDDVMFEHAPMQRLAADGQLMAFRHESFWQSMDTLREKHILQQLWDSGQAPWFKTETNTE